LHKSIQVRTNDPKHGNFALSVTGRVDRVVTVTPNTLRLVGRAGTPIRGAVAITPEEKYPFKIVEARARRGADIRFTLEEGKGPNGNGYLLTVENRRSEKGRYFDTIVLRTDSRIKPEIVIQVSGQILEPPEAS
jgi:hypothetical protein